MMKAPKIPRIHGKHPLIALRDQGHTLDEIRLALQHKNHTSIAIYSTRARKDRDLRVPAEWVLPLCRLSGFRPAQFRPDLYQPGWTVDSDNNLR
jgi:hypothetical protein